MSSSPTGSCGVVVMGTPLDLGAGCAGSLRLPKGSSRSSAAASERSQPSQERYGSFGRQPAVDDPEAEVVRVDVPGDRVHLLIVAQLQQGCTSRHQVSAHDAQAAAGDG